MPDVPTAHLNGIDVYYEREGTGPRLLFLNGSGATLATSAPLLATLRSRFDLLANDQRGLGQTSVPDGPYTMAGYAADAAALAESIGWASYGVIGISFGGMVAQELAVTFPQRIERLALVVTSPGGAGGSSYPLHTLVDMDPDERLALRLPLLDTRFDEAWLESHPNDRMLVEAMSARSADDKPADVLRGEALQLEARSHLDVYDRLANITCPTLVASGRYDGIAPPSNGEAIASQIPNSELRLYEGGHACFYQDRTAFPEIIEFLAG